MRARLATSSPCAAAVRSGIGPSTAITPTAERPGTRVARGRADDDGCDKPTTDPRLHFGSVLKAASRDELVSGVILRQLNDLKYEHLREWFAAVDRAIKLDCPIEDEIDALAEIKATRDILEHNAGVVNETYRRKAGKRARYNVGEHGKLDDAYHLESWKLIKKVVRDVTFAAVVRLSK